MLSIKARNFHLQCKSLRCKQIMYSLQYLTCLNLPLTSRTQDYWSNLILKTTKVWAVSAETAIHNRLRVWNMHLSWFWAETTSEIKHQDQRHLHSWWIIICFKDQLISYHFINMRSGLIDNFFSLLTKNDGVLSLYAEIESSKTVSASKKKLLKRQLLTFAWKTEF